MVVSKGKFAEQSNSLGSYFSLLINVYVNSTYTPTTADDYKPGLLVNPLVFCVFYVAKECADDGNVLWTSGFGAEGQGRDGYSIDMGFGVGEASWTKIAPVMSTTPTTVDPAA